MTETAPTVRQEIKQAKPFASPAVEAVVALFRTSDAIRHRVAATLEPHGLSPQQYNVLRILRGADGELPTLEIGSRMIERSPGITRLLDRLEIKGLVARERSTEDRRQVVCSITPKGVELLAKLDQPIVDTDETALAALSRAEQRQLVDLLDRVRAGGRS